MQPLDIFGSYIYPCLMDCGCMQPREGSVCSCCEEDAEIDGLWTVNQAAEYYGVSTPTVYARIRRGELKGFTSHREGDGPTGRTWVKPPAV